MVALQTAAHYSVSTMIPDDLPIALRRDIAAVQRIPAVPTILDVICRSTGMGFAAIARVTEDRWIACSVQDAIEFGLQPGGELKVDTTICDEIRETRQPVIINHAAEDEVYCDHATPALYGFQSYISMPIVLPDGTFFGTLCAIDPEPRKLDRPDVTGMFKLFAELIAFHLDAHERLAGSEATLSGEREVSVLREQFIAVLGHDLRNPLASVDAGVRLMLKYPQRAAELARQVQQSVSRMGRLIDNVLDFARGRLGGGIGVDRTTDKPLEPMLQHVVDELRISHPTQAITLDLALDEPVACDHARIGQLLSNLLGNALAHGKASELVGVQASARDGMFELAVSNAGVPIPPEAIPDLFKPFFRAGHQSSQEGLGLGLYIVSEIARAHGGTIGVTSTPERTCFTLRMPTGV